MRKLPGETQAPDQKAEGDSVPDEPGQEDREPPDGEHLTFRDGVIVEGWDSWNLGRLLQSLQPQPAG